ncbi:hypothetical protein Enr13x_09310 [Stieleria neptunia]|uniref:Uncharacterized protein n=1 Tax=Stieleria neptunia TaxID=2527979 RepID=A0A518HJS8_9BACT|nr:hypothetical protein Enr13x_09310 [Stieleria neptunia]
MVSYPKWLPESRRPVILNVPRKNRDSRRQSVMTDLLGRLFERLTLSVGGYIVALPTSGFFARLIDAA